MNSDRDIIKRFIELLAEIQPSISESIAANIERQLRHEYSGSRVYVHKRAEPACVTVAQHFNGRNADKLARELRVHRSTVYRAAKLRRIPKGK